MRHVGGTRSGFSMIASPESTEAGLLSRNSAMFSSSSERK